MTAYTDFNRPYGRFFNAVRPVAWLRDVFYEEICIFFASLKKSVGIY